MEIADIPSVRCTPRSHRLLGECVEKYRRAYRYGRRSWNGFPIGHRASCPLCCDNESCGTCPIHQATGDCCRGTPADLHWCNEHYTPHPVLKHAKGHGITELEWRTWAKAEYRWLQTLYDRAKVR